MTRTANQTVAQPTTALEREVPVDDHPAGLYSNSRVAQTVPDLAGIRESSRHSLPEQDLISAMSHDKKARAGTPRFVLLRSAGDLELDVQLDPKGLLA